MYNYYTILTILYYIIYDTNYIKHSSYSPIPLTALPCAELTENVRANLAVTIGRLGMVDTLEVAALADEFFADWCRYIYICIVYVLHIVVYVIIHTTTPVLTIPLIPCPLSLQCTRTSLSVRRTHSRLHWHANNSPTEPQCVTK